MDLLLMFIVVVAASFSVYYSIQTRSFRKSQDFDLMKYYNSKTNITMGIMLVAMAIVQLFMFPETTGWRIGVGIVFLLVGAFNLYMGIKHFKTYRERVQSQS